MFETDGAPPFVVLGTERSLSQDTLEAAVEGRYGARGALVSRSPA